MVHFCLFADPADHAFVNAVAKGLKGHKWSVFSDAGLQPGDMITRIGGKVPTSAQEVQVRIAATQPGTALLISVQRGQQTADTQLQVIEQPLRQR